MFAKFVLLLSFKLLYLEYLILLKVTLYNIINLVMVCVYILLYDIDMYVYIYISINVVFNFIMK